MTFRHPRLLPVALFGALTATCGAGPGAAAPQPAPAHVMYVTDYDHYTISEFDVRASGDARPLATIHGRRANLFKPDYVALDAAGYLYVQDAPYDYPQYPVVSVFPPGAHGDVAPVRTLNPESQGDVHPFGIAVDAGGYLYEADTDFASILVFAPGAFGDAVPVRAIGGAHTTLHNPFAVVVDAAGYTYVTDGAPEIAIFAPGASGDVAPVRRIFGQRPHLSGPNGVAFDAAGNMYVCNYAGGFITAFAPGANGNVRPIRTIVPATKPQSLGGIAEIDGDLIVTQTNAGTIAYSIAAYPETANGVTQALRTIAGPHTGLDGLGGIVVR
jgi:sugar lactone lactonase YvrE